MNRFKNFWKDKGFYLALLTCILAAALSSFWAIRTMIQNRSGSDTTQEEPIWEPDENLPVTENKEDVPIVTQPAQGSASSSGASAQSGASVQSGAPAQSAASSAQEQTSSFVWPVEGELLQSFSGDKLVYNATLKDWRTHNGMDLTAPAGGLVRAARAGEVTAVHTDVLWGRVVEVAAGEYTWRYCGLDTVNVEAGDPVEAGTTLGTLGTVAAESTEGSHLHLELLENGVYKDPAVQFE